MRGKIKMEHDGRKHGKRHGQRERKGMTTTPLWDKLQRRREGRPEQKESSGEHNLRDRNGPKTTVVLNSPVLRQTELS